MRVKSRRAVEPVSDAVGAAVHAIGTWCATQPGCLSSGGGPSRPSASVGSRCLLCNHPRVPPAGSARHQLISRGSGRQRSLCCSAAKLSSSLCRFAAVALGHPLYSQIPHSLHDTQPPGMAALPPAPAARGSAGGSRCDCGAAARQARRGACRLHMGIRVQGKRGTSKH